MLSPTPPSGWSTAVPYVIDPNRNCQQTQLTYIIDMMELAAIAAGIIAVAGSVVVTAGMDSFFAALGLTASYAAWLAADARAGMAYGDMIGACG
jgi:hypothetical protein